MSHHVGRAWEGHVMEDECPCAQAACGLVDRSTADLACPHHPWQASKTMRQGHAAALCHTGPVIEAWETESPALVVWGTHDPSLAAATAGKFYRTTVTPEDFPKDLHWLLGNRTTALWAHPVVTDVEDVEWPAGMLSGTAKPGWVPYLVLSL